MSEEARKVEGNSFFSPSLHIVDLEFKMHF